MKFQIGQYYQHTTGRVICILGQIHTFFHGSCLLAEEDTGTLIPVGFDQVSAQNWHQVSGWARSCYAGNSIPDPIEPPPREANCGSNAEVSHGDRERQPDTHATHNQP
jgi:hypothetical protein